MRLRVRALLRRSIVATAFLSVLVGVAGALVLTGVIGARRARTTYDDLLARNQPPDAVAVFCEATCLMEDGVDPTRYATPEDLAFLASLPGVTATSESTCLLGRLVREGHAATARDIGVGCLSLRPVPEALELHPVIVEGRAFDPGADELVIDEEQAARSGLAVGDRVQLTAFTYDQFAVLSSGRSDDASGRVGRRGGDRRCDPPTRGPDPGGPRPGRRAARSRHGLPVARHCGRSSGPTWRGSA